MLNFINIKLHTTTFLLLFTTAIHAQYPTVIKENIDIKVEVIEHEWIDSTQHQFIALSVTGLPEINTVYDIKDTTDSIKSPNPSFVVDLFGGAFGPIILLNKNQTFYPVKTYKEAIYDSLKQTHQVKNISLYLMDDFKHLKNNATLILYSRGCFGYANRSFAHCEDYYETIKYHKGKLRASSNIPHSSKKWYQNWLKRAPEDYWDPRKSQYYGEKHKEYENLIKRLNKIK